MTLGHDVSLGKRTQDVKITEDIAFDTMLLSANTLKGLRKSGFLVPSPIQLHGIPLGKCGFDLLLEAKSGTGKTAVFAVIALEKLDLSQGVQTIILAPTREIASQICDVINVIGAYYDGLNVAVVMGGLPVKDDIEKFKENVHIVVGSPGRLRHLIHDKHIDVSSVRLLVLDEADKLMEQSFLPDINYIFSLLPKQKQVVMSSATYPEVIKTFIGNYVKKAQHVCPDTNSILLGIEQKVIIIPYNCNIVKQTKHRYEELKKILSSKEFKQCLIFCNYQVRVAELHRLLTKDKWPSEQLYGNQDQNDRLGALKTLQEYKCRILVSTDLAARGIDASNVDLVINFEPPLEWQTYLHRIGRAGRFGSYGLAISFLSEGKEKTKFINTLALSKLAFNLKHYWTEETFNVNSTESSLENSNGTSVDTSETTSTASDHNVNIKDLITETNLQDNDIKQEILSFDELLDSFKTSCELNDPIKDINLEYKHLKIRKTPTLNTKNGINHFPNENNTTSISQTGHKNTKDETINVNGEEKSHLSKNKCKSGILAISNNNFNETEDNISHNGNVDDSSDGNKQDNFRKKSKEVGYDANKQALMEAGLPIAFGKPIYRQKFCANKANKFYCEIKKKNDEPTNVHNPYYKERKQCHKLNYSDKSISNGDLFKSCYSSSDSVQSSDERNEFLKRPQYKVNSKNYQECYRHQEYTDSREGKSKKFDNWYKQLRSQSQYIQYALYLEELKRL